MDDVVVRPAEAARLHLMGRRSLESVLKRAREQALREKRELKRARKDARTAERRAAEEAGTDDAGSDAR